jgi:hypothetical protein
MGKHHNHKTQNKEQFNSLDKFNSLINQASQAMSCNSECQRKKTEDKLKQKYVNAQTNLATAPERVTTSMKNYMVFAEGTPAYNVYLDKTLETKSTHIATQFKTKFTEDSGKFVSSIKTYNGLLINLHNVADLYKKYKSENIHLFKQLKDDTSDVLTNERKTYYQDQGIDTLKFFYSYFLITIYAICVIGFGVSSFMFPSKFGWKIRIGILVGLILLPFICTWILALIVKSLHKIYSVLPSNAHLSL